MQCCHFKDTMQVCHERLFRNSRVKEKRLIQDFFSFTGESNSFQTQVSRRTEPFKRVNTSHLESGAAGGSLYERDLDSPARPRDVVPRRRADRLSGQVQGQPRPPFDRGQGRPRTQTLFFQVPKRDEEKFANDPTAGSPTVTLLRLLLPLNAQVWESSRATLEALTTRGPVQIPH